MKGKGNPYHDPKNGRFISGYKEMEPNKDSDIQKNKDSAPNDNPKDLRAEGLRGDYHNSIRTSQELYDFTNEYIKNNKTEIDNLDLDNEDEVLSLVSKISNLETDGNKNPACYRTAGIMGAILDYRKIPYKAYNGHAHDKKDSRIQEIRFTNHTWIKTKNHIYQTFPNHNPKDIIIDSIIKDISFKKEKK